MSHTDAWSGEAHTWSSKVAIHIRLNDGKTKTQVHITSLKKCGHVLSFGRIIRHAHDPLPFLAVVSCDKRQDINTHGFTHSP